MDAPSTISFTYHNLTQLLIHQAGEDIKLKKRKDTCILEPGHNAFFLIKCNAQIVVLKVYFTTVSDKSPER